MQPLHACSTSRKRLRIDETNSHLAFQWERTLNLIDEVMVSNTHRSDSLAALDLPKIRSPAGAVALLESRRMAPSRG